MRPTYLWFKTGHAQWAAIVVLAVVIFQFDNVREKRLGPLSKYSGIVCFKNSCGTPVEKC